MTSSDTESPKRKQVRFSTGEKAEEDDDDSDSDYDVTQSLKSVMSSKQKSAQKGNKKSKDGFEIVPAAQPGKFDTFDNWRCSQNLKLLCKACSAYSL